MGETMEKGGIIMIPDDFRVYWFMIGLHNRLRSSLVKSEFNQLALSYLMTIRLFSPEKCCLFCHKKVGLLELLRKPSNFHPQREFGPTGEQLYRVVSHSGSCSSD
jgi:hypothetical protein